MDVPEYVTVEEVKRVCKVIGISDWSELEEPQINEEEAIKILEIVNVEGMPIHWMDFRQGLEVELEHGTRYKDANVTNNHPILTGKIVIAHLKETLDYYKRLEVIEIEGDLLKAIQSRDLGKIVDKYTQLVDAQKLLIETISNTLES